MITHAPESSEGLPSLRKSAEGFFHSEEVPYGMALVRIFFPWTLLCAHFVRWPWTRELYSTDGATTPLWNAYDTPNMLPEPSGEVAVALHTAMIFFMIASSAGWCTRLSLVLSAALFTYFNLLDCVGTIAKYSCIGTHVMLILAMSSCGDVWSVDAWRKRMGRRGDGASGEPAIGPPRSSMWARRLLQLFLGVVYFGAAVTKIKTSAFIGGDQLASWMITHVNFAYSPGEWLALHPALLVVAAYATVVWEMTFLFICWRGWPRAATLAMGVGFHVMTFVVLGLFVFPAATLAIYFAFLDERHYRMAIRRARSFVEKRRGLFDAVAGFGQRLSFGWPQWARLPALATFAMASCLVMVAGVASEYAMDPYKTRGPDGPLTLRPLDPEYVNMLMTPAPPLQDIDIFFSFDVGTIVIGGALLNQRTEFRPGEFLTAQCTAVPPHDDMFVECNLHDSNDRLIDRSGTIMARETSRGTFKYRLTSALEPGDYWVVLKKSGREITRRKVTLLSDGKKPAPTQAPVAN